MGMSATFNYSYDNKNNPYQNFLFGLIGFIEQPTFPMLNENNITKTVMTASMPILGGSETEEVSYSYTYDGDCPRPSLRLTKTKTIAVKPPPLAILNTNKPTARWR